MKKNSRIYIAGHTGFIGRKVTQNLKQDGYKNLILRPHKQLDLTQQPQVENLFKKTKPEYVFLLAAKVGGIYANNAYPAEFIYQNLAIQTNIIHSAYKYKVKKLLFLASACVYPKYCRQPMKPEHLLTGPIEPTNEPFAVAKIAGIKMCQAYNKQYNTNFICAVPATVYGPGDHFDENGHVAAGLLMRFYQAAAKKKNVVKVWGSGRPKREFIFIDDAAGACIFIMKYYNSSKLMHICGSEEISIKNLANKIKAATGYKGKVIFDKTRPDGIPRRLLGCATIKKLVWKPKFTLDRGLNLTYNWYKTAHGKII